MKFSPEFCFFSSVWGHTCLMVTQTGWVSQFTAHWVSGESNQPLSAQQVQTHLIALTETHNIYCHLPVRLHYVLANSHRRLPALWACAHVPSTPLPLPCSSGHASLNSICVCFVVYCCVALHHAPACFTATTCVCVDVTTTPASLLSSLPQRHCENTSPPWFPDVGTHPVHRLAANRITRVPYANDTKCWHSNVVNCHFFRTVVQKHWHS